MAKEPLGDLTDPNGLAARAALHLEWLRIKNYSERTITNRYVYLRYFIAWCDQRGLGRPADITRPILERYARYLYYYRGAKSGKALTFRSQHSRLTPVRALFKWLVRQNYLLSNPASELELPKLERRLPKHVLNIAEVEAVLSVPDTEDDLGLRDRAILEVFYSTGMRRRELMGLKLYDLDADHLALDKPSAGLTQRSRR